jgi:hypothetical protein
MLLNVNIYNIKSEKHCTNYQVNSPVLIPIFIHILNIDAQLNTRAPVTSPKIQPPTPTNLSVPVVFRLPGPQFLHCKTPDFSQKRVARERQEVRGSEWKRKEKRKKRRERARAGQWYRVQIYLRRRREGDGETKGRGGRSRAPPTSHSRPPIWWIEPPPQPKISSSWSHRPRPCSTAPWSARPCSFALGLGFFLDWTRSPSARFLEDRWPKWPWQSPPGRSGRAPACRRPRRGALGPRVSSAGGLLCRRRPLCWGDVIFIVRFISSAWGTEYTAY